MSASNNFLRSARARPSSFNERLFATSFRDFFLKTRIFKMGSHGTDRREWQIDRGAGEFPRINIISTEKGRASVIACAC